MVNTCINKHICKISWWGGNKGVGGILYQYFNVPTWSWKFSGKSIPCPSTGSGHKG